MDALFEFYPAKLERDKAPRGLISIPHSGLKIPPEYRDAFIADDFQLNCDVDLGVHECVDLENLQSQGIHIIKFNYHRTFVDLNRSRDMALQNWKKNTRGIDILTRELTDEKILEKYWDGYYFIIKQFISNTETPFPLIDLHSMPSKATEFHLKKNPNQKIQRPEFCLSDYYGESSPKEFIDLAQEIFLKNWETTKVNDPYFGGHLTQYFKTFKNPNIQVEINRSLYMNEETQKLDQEKIAKFKDQLTDSLSQLLTSWFAAKKESV